MRWWQDGLTTNKSYCHSMHTHVHMHTKMHIQPEMHRSQLCKLCPQKSPDRKFYQLWDERTQQLSCTRTRAHALIGALQQRTHTRHALLDKVPEQPMQRFPPDPTLPSVRSGKKKIQARTCTDADIKTSCTVSCRPSWMSHWWTGDGESVSWHGQYHALSHTHIQARTNSISQHSLTVHSLTDISNIDFENASLLSCTHPAQRSKARERNSLHNEKPHLTEPSKRF